MGKFLYGPDFVYNRDWVLKDIREAVKKGVSDIWLIVPENLSHEMERRLCEVCGNSVCLHAEVVTLSRLASRMSDAEGGAAQAPFDRGGKLLAMARSCYHLRSELKHFSSGSTRESYLQSLVDVCDELEGCCIRPEDLRAAADRLSGEQAQKIGELALIADIYAGFCKNHESSLTHLQNLLAENPEAVSGKTIWIYGFVYMTKQERNTVRTLTETCRDFTVFLSGDLSQGQAGIFAPVREIARELSEQTTEKARILANTDRRNPALRRISSELFTGGYRKNETDTAGDALTVRSAPSPAAECLACADRILYLVRHEGARYRDIHVAYTDAAKYVPVLKATLAEYGIPVYVSGMDPMDRQPITAFVLSAIEAADRLETDEVIRHLKTGYGPLSAEESDEVENYVRTWKITGQGWLKAWTLHPDGFGAKDNAYSASRLSRLNDLRARLMEPLGMLRKKLKEARTAADQIAALYAYFRAVKLDEQLMTRAESFGNEQAALVLKQLFDILCEALAEMEEILGQEVCSTDEFSRLLQLILSQYGVATITPYVDTLEIGPVGRFSLSECEHLLVLGAEDSLFPNAPGRTGLLTDQDRDTLRKLHLPLRSGTREEFAFTLLTIWFLLSTPNRTLYLSWCSAGRTDASYLVKRMTNLFSDVAVMPAETCPAIRFLTPQSAAAVLTENGAEENTAPYAECHALENATVRTLAQEYREKADFQVADLALETAEALYGECIRLSASSVEQENKCRFSYFMRYGLDARDGETAAFDGRSYGTFVHDVLEKTVNCVKDEGGYAACTPERNREIVDEKIADYIRMLNEKYGDFGAQPGRLCERTADEIRVMTETLRRELADSQFVPVWCELRFAEDGTIPAISVAGETASAVMTGIVDRVDLWKSDAGTYLRVLDYKTGQKEMDYTDLLHGIGLQPLIYLFVLCRPDQTLCEGPLLPAGMLYVPARAPFAKPEEGPEERKGLLLANPDVIAAMHSEDTLKLLPIKYKSDGTMKKGEVATAEQMRILETFVRKKLGETADEIHSGRIAPNPYRRGDKSECAYCVFSQACRLDLIQDAVRNRGKTEATEFWAAISADGAANNGKEAE